MTFSHHDPALMSAHEKELIGLNEEAGTYKDSPVVRGLEWQHPRHAHRPDSFYVQAKDGSFGWVPWVGSPVVWPTETAAWEQDLYVEGREIAADLKPERKR